MLSWIALVVSIPFLLLGAHGLYAYFYPLDTLGALISEKSDRLFFSITVPNQVSGVVHWMSLRGIQSFFIPGLVVLCGGALLWFVFKNGLRVRLPRWRRRRFVSRSSQQDGRYRRQGFVGRSYDTSGWRGTVIRILLNLSIFVGSIVLMWYGYKVFSHETSPLSGALLLLLGAALLGTLIWLLRKRYIWLRPSFVITSLCIAAVVVVFAFAGVEPFQKYKNNVGDTISGWFSASSSATRSSVNLPTITLKAGTIYWEVILKSAKWSGQRVSVVLSVTNKGNKPADFPYPDLDPIGVVVDFAVLDSYGVWYPPDGSPTFNVQRIYPGETRTFRPVFTVNSRSGNVTLYVTWYTGTKQARLFDLGAPK